MMRRVICFLLVMALCLSMSCVAFAATSSAGDSGKPSRVPSSNPRTGDAIMQWVIIMFLALIALAAVIVCYRKFAR